MMDRRRFVSTLACGLAATPSDAEAQSDAKMYRVGFLLGATGESVASTRSRTDCASSDISKAATSSSSNGTETAGWSDFRILPPS